MAQDRAQRPGEQSIPPSTSDPSISGSGVDSSRAVGTYFLGRYRVVDEIGIGGMASVHLARMDGPGGFQKWVAIKRIHSHLVEDDSFIQMFLDEARVAARISHPNVATVFELGKHEDTYWIAMEYLHGEPLREVMRRTEETGAPMPPEIACRVIADAAEGLHAAHELLGKNGEKLGLVHRDVTPHNLFVTYDGNTKVVDFGIAKFSSRMSNTRAGTLKGKLAYMSPEQVHGEGIDRRTDIFALGVVLWELTTGQRLFRMDSDLDTLAKVQECAVPRPSTIVRGYPIDLEKIVMKALAKNRGERFRTAREFSRALQSLLMRRGLFIASDEVANYIQSIFQDRIQKREAHLRWAADVTQTINVEQILAKPSLPGQTESSLVTFNSDVQASVPNTRNPPRPAAGMPAPAVSAPLSAGQRVPRPLNTTQESAPTAPRPGAVTARPPAMGAPPPVISPVFPPHAAPGAEADDGPTIQAPPGMNPGAEFARGPHDEPPTVQASAGAVPHARAAMIAAMVAEEAANARVPNLADEDDDDQDDTIVQTTRVDPQPHRGPGAPLPAAGRPADVAPPETVQFAGPPRPATRAPLASTPPPLPPPPAMGPQATPPGAPPPPMMQRPDPYAQAQHAQTGPMQFGRPDDSLSAPRMFSSLSRDNRTVTAQALRRRPPAWIVALASATVVLVIAAIVIGVATTRHPTSDPATSGSTGGPATATAPTATSPAPAPAASGMGPFTSARAAFATIITSPGAQNAPAEPPAGTNAAPPVTAATPVVTTPPSAAAPTPPATPPPPPATPPPPVAITPTRPTPPPAPVAPPTPPRPAPAAGGTGVLTVICFPACDHVLDNGRDLGASPVWQKQVQAGEHRLKLTTANPPATKIITVIVAADELKTIKQPMTQ